MEAGGDHRATGTGPGRREVTEEGAGQGWRPLRRPSRPSRAAGRPAGPSPFGRLVVAQALSVAGDALVAIALAGSLFFDISPHAARGKVALSLVLTMAPFAVVAPLLGPAIDRRAGGRRATLVGAAAGRVVTALAMVRYLHGLGLFPVALASLVLSKAHAVAKSSLVPTTIEDPDRLVPANARLALVTAAAGVVAALPGVLLLKTAGAGWDLRLAAATFAAAAVAARRLRQVRPDEPGGRPLAAAALHEADLRPAVVAMAALRAGVGFIAFAAAFALRRQHAASWVFGAVLLASMAGSFAAAAVTPRLRRWLSEERLLLAALLLVGVTAGAAVRWLAPHPSIVVVAAVLGTAASGAKLAFDSLVQRDAPAAAQGRQFARFEAIFQLCWVAGALAPVVVPITLRASLVLLALGAVVAAVAPEVQHRHRSRSG